jgi:hypothetical protein
MGHDQQVSRLDDAPDQAVHVQMTREHLDELSALRNALRVEVARSDFLWDRARARGLVTDEEYALAQDPAKLAKHSW